MTHRNGTAAKPPDTASRTIPLSRIVPSPLNPRKTFDETALRGLADSIRAVGVLEPILVRPLYKTAKGKWLPTTELSDFTLRLADLPEEQLRYEIVVGERRYRAAKLAKLADIPATVRELTDRQVLEAQFVEDLQRQDIDDLERGAGLRRLIEEHGATAEELAERIGKSIATVRNLLRMPDLPAVAQAAYREGRIASSTAAAIARVPGAQARERIARLVLAGEEWYSDEPPTDKHLEQRRERGDEPLTYVRTKELIRNECMVELKRAPFSRQSLDLVPSAGSCDACPKLAGNLAAEDPEFADVRADMCTDPDCYRAKVEAHAAKVVAAQEAAGRPVLHGDAAADIFAKHMPGHVQSPDWIDLGTTCYSDPKGRPWQKLVGKQLKDEITVAVDANGQAHNLVPAPRAREILKRDHGVKEDGTSSSASDQRYRREQAAQRAKQKAGRAAAAAACATVAAAAERMAGRLIGWTADDLERLRALAVVLVHGASPEACAAIRRRRGAAAKDDGEGRTVASREGVADLVRAAATAAEVLGLLAELAAAGASATWGAPHFVAVPAAAEAALWSAWGVDPKRLQKDAAKEGKEKRKEKKAAKKAAKPPTPADCDGRWETEVRDPAESAAEPEWVIEVKDARASYQLAGLPCGRHAITFQLDLGATCGRGTPWQAHESRAACIDAFLAVALDFYKGEKGHGSLTNAQKAALPRMFAKVKEAAKDFREGRKNTVGEAAAKTKKDRMPPIPRDSEAAKMIHALHTEASNTPTFKPGDRVLSAHHPGRVGTVKEARPADKARIAMFYVEWDLKPGERKKGAHWCAADNLKPHFTRETLLRDLVEISVGEAALLGADRLYAVGDLLARAWTYATGPEKQRPYTVLRSVPGDDFTDGLSAATVNAIGDALIDADLVCCDKDDREAWRLLALPMVELLDMPQVDALAKRGIEFLGTLADRLDAGDDCGLKKKLVAQLKQHIEIARSTAAAPSPAETLAKRAAERRCRMCGCTEADPHVVWETDDLCGPCAVDEEAEIGAEMEEANA